MSIGVGVGIVFDDFSLWQPEALALIARMTVPPSAARQSLINNLIGTLKATGVWGILDVLWVFAAHDSQAGLLNWKSSSFTATAVNSPTFTTDRGYSGDAATSYLDTGFNTSTNGVNVTQNSNHIGLWSNTNMASSAKIDLGNTNFTINSRTGGNIITARASNSGQASSSASFSTSVGHSLANRSLSSAIGIYKNATLDSSPASASLAPAAFNIFVGAQNNSGTPGSFSDRRVAATHLGGALTAQNITDLYGALNTYLTAIGGA